MTMRPSFADLQMEQLTLQPIKSIGGHVQLPGSKSLSNRVLLLAALSEGTTLVKNLLVILTQVIMSMCVTVSTSCIMVC